MAAEFFKPKSKPAIGVPGKGLHDFRVALFSPDFDKPIWAPGFQSVTEHRTGAWCNLEGLAVRFFLEGLRMEDDTRFDSCSLIDPSGIVVMNFAFRGGDQLVRAGDTLRTVLDIPLLDHPLPDHPLGTLTHFQPYLRGLEHDGRRLDAYHHWQIKSGQ